MTLVVSSGRPTLRRFAPWIPFILIAAVGVLLILVYTRFGAGLGGDAVRYVVGAESLLSGRGYSYVSGGGEVVPIISFPPFFPIVLAGLGLTGVDLFELARLLNTFLFGATLFLCGFLLYRHTQSTWSSVIGCLLILAASAMIELFGWAMSEALYIFLMLSVILGTAVYLDRENLWLLAGIGILSGLAVLTRYVGMGLVGATGLSVLLLSKTAWRRRFTHALIFSILGVTPILVWFWRNAQVSGSLANRSLIFHPMRGELIRQYAEEMALWLVPAQFDLPRIRYRILLAVGVLVVGAILILLPRIVSKDKQRPRNLPHFTYFPWILVINIFSYLAVLVLNSTFLDAGTTPGAVPRYLGPIFIMVVMLIVSLVNRFLDGVRTLSIPRIGLAVISVVLITLYAQLSVNLVANPDRTLGYVTAKMFWVEEIAALEEIDTGQTIVSNNPELAYILTGRTTYMMPLSFNPNNLEAREDFPEQLSVAHDRLSGGGVLVIFGYGDLDDNGRKVVEGLGVVPLQILNMAKIYALP